MAPEVIKQSGYDHRADIWSLGITALELANGEPPYADIHPMKVLFLIPKNPPPRLESGTFSRAFQDFIACCLQRDPKDRPTAKDLLKHPFVRKARKTTYLTELIERHTRWSATHKNTDDDDNYDEVGQSAYQQPVDEDMWDFGTVRLVGNQGHVVHRPGLNAMDESATNARSSKPLAADDDYGERRREVSPQKAVMNRERDVFKSTDSPSGTARQVSPQRKPVSGVPTGSPTKVPLPPFSSKANPKSSYTSSFADESHSSNRWRVPGLRQSTTRAAATRHVTHEPLAGNRCGATDIERADQTSTNAAAADQGRPAEASRDSSLPWRPAATITLDASVFDKSR